MKWIAVALALFLVFASSLSAEAIKAKGSSSDGTTEEDKVQDVEDQGGDVEDSTGTLQKLQDANGGVELINPHDNLGADLPTRSEVSAAVIEVDLDDAPESIKIQVHAEVNAILDGRTDVLATGVESMMAWAANEAANKLGRGELPYTTAFQENPSDQSDQVNRPGLAFATSGEADFQCFDWKVPSDREEMGTISAMGREKSLTVVSLFPPLVKVATGESDD